MTAKLFVMGTGRSGTHSLVSLLGAMPDTMALHEGQGGDVSGDRHNLGNLMGLNVLLGHARRRSEYFRQTFQLDGLAREVMERAFQSRRELIAKCESEGWHYCDVNRMGYNFINYIHEQYPDAKFVHVVRDGYRCVRSWYGRIGAYPEFRDLAGFKLRMMKKRYLERGRGGLGLGDVLYDIYVAALLRGGGSKALVKAFTGSTGRNQHLEKPVPFPDDPSYHSWRSFSRLQKLAWFWVWVNECIQQRLDLVPEQNRMVVRIEDLKGDANRRLVEFADLPWKHFEEEKVVRGRSREYAMRWGAETVRQFNDIAGASMKKYGYELRDPSSAGTG
jgi:hypothetical protein